MSHDPEPQDADDEEYFRDEPLPLYPRDRLIPMRLYKEAPTGSYFYTPDGIGCVWFDSLTEALEQTAAFCAPIIVIMNKLED